MRSPLHPGEDPPTTDRPVLLHLNQPPRAHGFAPGTSTSSLLRRLQAQADGLPAEPALPVHQENSVRSARKCKLQCRNRQAAEREIRQGRERLDASGNIPFLPKHSMRGMRKKPTLPVTVNYYSRHIPMDLSHVLEPGLARTHQGTIKNGGRMINLSHCRLHKFRTPSVIEKRPEKPAFPQLRATKERLTNRGLPDRQGSD